MRKTAVTITLTISMLFSLAGAAPSTSTGRIDFAELSKLTPAVRVEQASSRDPSGKNHDYDQYIRTVDDENVLLDVEGPGCIQRIWITAKNWQTDRILRIYFDGADQPTVEMTVGEFFSGRHAPFLFPLVGDFRVSSGGFYCYVPMPFRAGCRISTTEGSKRNYYNITYHRYPSADGITTFTGNVDVADAVEQWRDPTTPSFKLNTLKRQRGTVTVASDDSPCFAEIEGPAVTRAFEIDMPGLRHLLNRTVVDEGRAFNESSTFRVALDPANEGVRLTRRLNFRTPDQTADVYVDGKLAGSWFTPSNDKGVWRDASFWIPPAMTRGKRELAIRVTFTHADYDYWNEHYYWVHSRVGYRDVLTDELDVGKPASEKAHGYRATHEGGPAPIERMRRQYLSPWAPYTISDDGRAFGPGGHVQFRVAVNPDNEGVEIQRRLDPNIGNQKAEVLVRDEDGQWQPVGQWFTPGSGETWDIDGFTIPKEFTAGRSELAVRIRFISSDHDWNEFHYWIFSHRPDRSAEHTDTIDVGQASDEAYHEYAIVKPTWEGVANKLHPQSSFEEARQRLNGLRLKVWWDDQKEPAIDAPMGLFFGSGLGPAPVHALPVGIDGDRLYCYFPMPFARQARFAITGDEALLPKGTTYTIHYEPRTAPLTGHGRFRAIYRKEFPTTLDRDYLFGQVQGSGHVVGVGQVMHAHNRKRWYLEGDERVYIDGSATPAVYGTGTEDLYNAGWYFAQGPFTTPVHGNPLSQSRGRKKDTCYRFFLTDRIPFTRSIRFGIEHGGHNEEQLDIESVLYLYHQDKPQSHVTDTLDVGDIASELRHGYDGPRDDALTLTASYEGDDDVTERTDTGRVLPAGRACRFTLNIDPDNAGVILRRRMDWRTADQRAEVYVDDQKVGTWYDAGANAQHAFRDSEFLLPASVTAGHDNLTIRLLNPPDGPDWTHYRYEVLTLDAGPR